MYNTPLLFVKFFQIVVINIHEYYTDSTVQYICSRHDFPYIRGWMQMVTGTKWFIFLKQWYSKEQSLLQIHYKLLYNAHNTHSVHNCLLKSRRDLLLSSWSFCNVSPPPLSGTNCRPSPFPSGAGPPVPKVASLFPGSAHTPSLPSITTVHTVYKMCTVKDRLEVWHFKENMSQKVNIGRIIRWCAKFCSRCVTRIYCTNNYYSCNTSSIKVLLSSCYKRHYC